MADLKLDILVIPTYNSKTLGIADISTYPASPPVQSPTIEITIPGFGLVSIPFVPNDFNVLQAVYLEKMGSKPWFLVLPDHINYFSLETIDGVLEKAGYKTIHKTVQYPLEFFLLQGDDYVEKSELGKICHRKRVTFEEAFRKMDRDRDLEQIYEGFAKIGIGRDMYIIGKPLP